MQMCCFLRLFLPHSFSNQSENCLTDSGSKCLLHVTQEENCPVKVLVLVIFSQSSESRFIIRCCQFNVIKICVTNKKRQYIKEYVRRPSNEVWLAQSLLKINNILTWLFNACPSHGEWVLQRIIFSKSVNLKDLFRKRRGVLL